MATACIRAGRLYRALTASRRLLHAGRSCAVALDPRGGRRAPSASEGHERNLCRCAPTPASSGGARSAGALATTKEDRRTCSIKSPARCRAIARPRTGAHQGGGAAPGAPAADMMKGAALRPTAVRHTRCGLDRIEGCRRGMRSAHGRNGRSRPPGAGPRASYPPIAEARLFGASPTRNWRPSAQSDAATRCVFTDPPPCNRRDPARVRGAGGDRTMRC